MAKTSKKQVKESAEVEEVLVEQPKKLSFIASQTCSVILDNVNKNLKRGKVYEVEDTPDNKSTLSRLESARVVRFV